MRSETVSEIHRRDFLKISAAGAVAASLPNALHALSSDSPAGSITAVTTDATRKYVKLAPIAWSKAQSAGANTVTINPSQQYQEVVGFGGAFTDATCFTLNRLDTSVRTELFREWFDPKEMGLSIGRVCIGASDYSVKAYSYADSPQPDPELKSFTIEHDREYILPILKQARALNPNLWLLGSPWSPPGWMKFNNSMLGGSMRRKYLGTYAQYFEKFLDAYAAEGVRINSVTSQNEVDTDQDGRMPACIWPQEYEIEFVRDHLAPRLAKAANPADIWILDHNYNLWGRVMGELEDPGTRKVVKGVAWHGYVGSADAMTKVKKAYPAMDMFWTEGGPDFEAPGYDVEWAKWGAQYFYDWPSAAWRALFREIEASLDEDPASDHSQELLDRATTLWQAGIDSDRALSRAVAPAVGRKPNSDLSGALFHLQHGDTVPMWNWNVVPRSGTSRRAKPSRKRSCRRRSTRPSRSARP